jgi:hypothetical protein
MKMEVIAAKWNWDRIKDGTMEKLQFFKETDLHHLFGGDPTRLITKLRIEEINGEATPPEQGRGENV